MYLYVAIYSHLFIFYLQDTIGQPSFDEFLSSLSSQSNGNMMYRHQFLTGLLLLNNYRSQQSPLSLCPHPHFLVPSFLPHLFYHPLFNLCVPFVLIIGSGRPQVNPFAGQYNCSEGFYRGDDGYCYAECGKWNLFPKSTQVTSDVFCILAICVSILSTVAVLVVAILKRRRL